MNNMKRVALKVISLVAFSSVCWVGTAPAEAATSTANLSVSASVSANCTISTSALSFGTYDPVSANASSALDGTGSVTVTCTSGASAVVTLGQGNNAAAGSSNAAPLRQMSDGGSNVMAYSLYQDSGHSTSWGNTAGTGAGVTGSGSAQSLTVYGRIAGGQNLPAGSYSDTVVATVTF